MFSWAKELLSPTVQTGKPVEEPENRKKSKSDADSNEMTEEGFVCIGKSSFYKSPEMSALAQPFSNSPYPPVTASQPPYPGGPSVLYPTLPYQPTDKNISSVPDNSDLVRQIPFTTRAGVQMKLGGYVQQKPFELYLNQLRYSSDRLRFEYDFDFERGVLREMS